MKTAVEIIKTLAEKSPITHIYRHEQLWKVCYYCEQVQHYAVPLRHGPDCLWLEMQQIVQERK